MFVCFIRAQGTPEQRSLVKRINGCENYYDILGISDKQCSEDAIKRSYKKLALKLHPDKCRVRGAEDAFKAVSRAFSCLSDPSKRRSYDRFGSEQPGESPATLLSPSSFPSPLTVVRLPPIARRVRLRRRWRRAATTAVRWRQPGREAAMFLENGIPLCTRYKTFRKLQHS